MRRIGRYALFDVVGHGGTATVHLGRLVGPAGFSKTVAIKRMHESVSRDSDVAAMFLDEARISARIRHPNVVAATDFLAVDEETFLVMEYVHGESLSVLNDALRARGSRMPVTIAVHVMRDVLLGLHAAHETKDDHGQPLHLVHRDVSPQNVQIGIDGTARVLDFGIAKALGRLQDTHTGQVKGKLSYMAPEQLLGQRLDRRVDVFAAGVVLWESLVGKRLFTAENPGQVVQRVLTEDVPRLDTLLDDLSPHLVAAVARATSKEPEARFDSALDFARELERAAELVPNRAVGEWVKQCAGERLERRTQRLAEIERTPIAAPRPFEPILDEVASMPAGADDATRSEFHVRLLADETGPSHPGVKTPPVRRGRALLAGAAAGVLVASGWLAFSREATNSERQGTAVALPTPIPRDADTQEDDSALVLLDDADPNRSAELAGAGAESVGTEALPSDEKPALRGSPLAQAQTELGFSQAERPRKTANQKARLRARVARERSLADDKPAKQAAKPPVRRAEDLFSRN